LLRWMVEKPLAVWPANRVLRKARRLERQGRVSEAYEETLRALRILGMRCWDYWNPFLFEKRINATVYLDELAVAMGAPPPGEQIREVVEAIRMLRVEGGSTIDEVYAKEIKRFEHRLLEKPVALH